jgi:single-strand DNA-binding protein
MNKVILIGNTGKAPEMKKTTKGTSVATVSLATTKKYKDADGNTIDDTQWHNLTFYGKLAEIVEKYVGKGHQLAVEGEIKNSSYEKDGEKKYYSEVVVDKMEMLGRPKSSDSDAGSSASGNDSKKADSGKSKQAVAPAKTAQQAPPTPDASEEDDLPF